MKYLFILGRNVELSTEEVKSFLRKEGIDFRVVSKVENGLLIETKRIIKGIVDKLGGVISIGEVLAEGEFKEIMETLESKPLYSVRGNKLNYVLYNFHGKEFERVSFYLKNRFRIEGLKATAKNLTGRINLQAGEEVPKASSNLIDEQYFLFENFFGRIIEETDYEKLEKRDMGKPVRRNELSISPRLAKIMINLAEIRQGKVLLDPFCGIGTILQEALLQGINVIGIDKDKKAVYCSELNLEWFKFPKSAYRLINADSSNFIVSNVDAIVTEPQLGELLRKVPSETKAQEIVKKFENLIVPVLRNLKKEVRGRIVFTAPLILTDKKDRIQCNFNNIKLLTGLKIVKGFPVDEYRWDSIVGRSIVVMEK